MFPYLLVNCGSGVSILRVDSETKFTRVSGTSLGGGTLSFNLLFNICSLFIGDSSYESLYHRNAYIL